MTDLKASEAKSDFGPMLERVHYHGERVRITKHGRPMAALVPIEDLELLERLEDAADLELVREALSESDERVPFDKLRKELGI